MPIRSGLDGLSTVSNRFRAIIGGYVDRHPYGSWPQTGSFFPYCSPCGSGPRSAASLRPVSTSLERRIWRLVARLARPLARLRPGSWSSAVWSAQAAICRAAGSAAAGAAGEGQDGTEDAAALATLHAATAKAVAIFWVSCVPRRGRVLSHVTRVPRSRRRRGSTVGDQSPCLRTIASPLPTLSSSSRPACLSPRASTSGTPLQLQSWQKDWIRTVYDNPVGTRRAILSTPRKNAKTSLSAALLLAHLCGPPARNRPNSQLFYRRRKARDQAGHHLCAGGEDGAHEPRPGAGRHHPGNRQGASLS